MNQFIFRVFLVYVFAYTFFFASRPLSDPDFWFHLKTGEYIVQTGHVPTTEFSSFTHFGKPFIAHGWLSGLIFYVVYTRFGTYALTFIFAAVGVLAFWLVFKRMRNCHPLIAGFAILLGVTVSIATLGVRARVFTLLFASVFLWLLSEYIRGKRTRAIWLLVPLMVLWVNLHGGFLIGLALIAVTLIGIVLDAWAAGEPVRQRLPAVRLLAMVFVGCLLAGLVNPYGVRLYTQGIRVMSSPVFTDLVSDWLSPNFHKSHNLPLLFLILLTITALALSPKRARPSELLLLVGTLYATLQAHRHAATFALVASPLMATYLQNWLKATSFGSDLLRERESYSNRRAKVIGIVLLVPLVAVAIKFRSSVYTPPRQETLNVPVKAVQFLKENRIEGKTFTEPNLWGSYVAWELRSNPIYIDGRDVYAEPFVREYADIINGRKDWHEPFDRYGVEIAVIRPNTLLARELEKSWRVVYRDDMALVFTRQ
jgi:hypothetical protein